MYAVIQTGGKQYLVREGEELLVEKIPGEAKKALEIKDVLFMGSEGAHKVGQPTVKGAVVKCQILGQEKGKKLTVFKFRRRKNSKRKTGHRQTYTRLRIEKIEG